MQATCMKNARGWLRNRFDCTSAMMAWPENASLPRALLCRRMRWLMSPDADSDQLRGSRQISLYSDITIDGCNLFWLPCIFSIDTPSKMRFKIISDEHLSSARLSLPILSLLIVVSSPNLYWFFLEKLARFMLRFRLISLSCVTCKETLFSAR